MTERFNVQTAEAAIGQGAAEQTHINISHTLRIQDCMNLWGLMQ